MLEIPLKFENCFQWNRGSSASVYEAWVILAGAMHGQFCKLRREEISNTHLNMLWCKIKKTLYCLNGKIMEVNGGGSSTPCFKKLEAIYLPNWPWKHDFQEKCRKNISPRFLNAECRNLCALPLFIPQEVPIGATQEHQPCGSAAHALQKSCDRFSRRQIQRDAISPHTWPLCRVVHPEKFTKWTWTNGMTATTNNIPLLRRWKNAAKCLKGKL